MLIFIPESLNNFGFFDLKMEKVSKIYFVLNKFKLCCSL